MKTNYSPSINIIRDAQKEMEYIITENAEKSAIKILNDFNKGFHSFSIIGSYGTGKSSFLWALQQTLTNKKTFFDVTLPKNVNTVDVINIVGDYHSLIQAFNDVFSIKDDYTSNQKLFDCIFQTYTKLGKNGLLVIVIDEFGKFLEYAANNNPEKEMYFIQQLAEFVNDPNRNILLLTSLHQGLDTYAYNLSSTQKNEWKKVKGRIQEIAFNEPVEQLLTLASKHFVSFLGETKENNYSKTLLNLQKTNYVFSAKTEYFEKIKNSLYPLDIFSAYILTLALQKYGQNERSLFSFLQASDDLGLNDTNRKDILFSIPSVYNYLLSNHYHFLTSSANPDYSNWNFIKDSLQRAEVIDDIKLIVAQDLIKTIGLLQIFASKGAKINDDFLINYLLNKHKKGEIEATIKILDKNKIIRYSKFNFSYQLYQGTDLDIERALIKAENQVSQVVNLVPKLSTYFNFPIVTAKSNSYRTGTPRLFEYELSETPIFKTPEGEIDGFINLIFNPKLSVKKIQEATKDVEQAIMYVFFKNSDKISSALYDIEKTKQVLSNIEDDKDWVAIRELQSIINSNTILLNHYVLDALFNNDVEWIYKGNKLTISNKKELNKKLSVICDEVYKKTPIIRNELFNKHNVSAAISTARKSYFKALVNSSHEEELGFEPTKFPPEKTIYYTLLVKNGIHKKAGLDYGLFEPDKNSDLYELWKVSSEFLASAKNERKNITELINVLTSAPYKIKQGIIDFWIPTFLFIRKGDYALYSEGVFKPYINEQTLYLITRNPQDYQIKSFELNDLRLSFFNKYRELLRQENSTKFNVETFIESVRPILLTFKELTIYSQRTKRLSKEAINLRNAIQFAEDPEKLFFDEFPKSLGFNSVELLKSEQKFDDYIYKFQNTLDEIRNSYSELLNRVEKFIAKETLNTESDFNVYKQALSKRFSTLKDHQLLAKQKTFLQRVNSPLNDRDSWLESIGQALIGKPITTIEDKEEKILKDNFKHFVKELDNLCEIEKLEVDEEKEDVFKFDFTTKKSGLIPHVVRVSKDKILNAEKNISAIQKELGQDKQIRIAILAKLLKIELDNE